jgi:hypothetical protein
MRPQPNEFDRLLKAVCSVPGRYTERRELLAEVGTSLQISACPRTSPLELIRRELTDLGF